MHDKKKMKKKKKKRREKNVSQNHKGMFCGYVYGDIPCEFPRSKRGVNRSCSRFKKNVNVGEGEGEEEERRKEEGGRKEGRKKKK